MRHGKGVVAEQLSRGWPNSIFIEEDQLASEPQRIELLLRCYLLLDIAMNTDEQLPLLLGHYARLLNREPGQQALLALLTSQPLPLQANGNIVPS